MPTPDLASTLLNLFTPALHQQGRLLQRQGHDALERMLAATPDSHTSSGAAP